MIISRRQTLAMLAAPGLSPQQRVCAAAALPQSLAGEQRALHALNRLGFGPRPADAAAIQRLGADAWLTQFLAQQMQAGQPLAPPWAARLQGMAMQTLSQAELLGRYREAQRAGREEKRSPAGGAEPEGGKARRELLRPLLLEASEQRLLRALHSPGQLEEVLVDFWFNHFNVFAGKGPVGVLIGNYEREAIRPHVFGKFRSMLGATAKHPAMLIYLDNVQSVAPGYQPPRRFGQEGGKAPKAPTGLNENYARELMELHSLGVDGGYTQRDVTELARMLTGWTVDYRAAMRGAAGPLFHFDAGRHDGGVKQWMGRRVEPAGQREGEWALDMLAAHPATARHIAFKLAQAFVSDAPAPALVQRLSDNFLATQGDLRALMQCLIKDEEFWRQAHWGAKFKTPYQYLLSSLRALDISPAEPQAMLGALAQAGMPLYGAQTPDGYKNVAGAWMNAEALAQRVQWASRIGGGPGRGSETSSQALASTLGAILQDGTRQMVAAEPADSRMALLLASAEFMHR
ncbi:DUF1800 domain-containing protein [Roseateles oligotrophus]|uniref:DUF1800 domain-containing protein n=1 Tax=Roseateles oligotrophus TaxID=1769250 RepID=A0ABT2YBM2_9BURK|nr:DUF1800 domain-containing protein [Roseateles oligotrophus]MCV2367547.1 DUF1800 domain-containing protein [Roseateles oligotrophus]